MNANLRSIGRTIWAAIRIMLVFTVVLGVAYPLLITGIGQAAFAWQANGSPIRNAGGQIVGSALIGQSFVDASGNPLPQYFQPRPSAAGDGYDGAASAGSNKGPEDADLIAAVAARRAQIAAFNGVSEADVPADAVTASGSGLDPDISVAYADIQIQRVATARGIPADQVRALVEANTDGPGLGYIGEPCVHVVQLNLALDERR